MPGQVATIERHIAQAVADGGRIVAGGTPDEVRASPDPFVHQFLAGDPDGPVPFHYAARPLAEDFVRAR